MSRLDDTFCRKERSLGIIYEVPRGVPFVSRSGVFTLYASSINVARLTIATPLHVFTLCNLSVTVDNPQFIRNVVKYNDEPIYSLCSHTSFLWNPGREKGPSFRSPSYLYIETYNYDTSDHTYYAQVDLWKARSPLERL